ncbi:MAG TPA: DUF6051 family protein [Bacteroidales bacterium]|nr:DUF6051 family protein [Bacteroidales bacterium]
MNFIQEYEELKSCFNLKGDSIPIGNSKLVIRNFDFTSKNSYPECQYNEEDTNIPENYNFRYPVIFPEHRYKTSRAIILLHGLNERTWHKHLTGAKFLASKTGKAVILFPLSFHINRGLPDWMDVRKMSVPLEQRKAKYPGIKDATVVNLALSERLTDHPERFLFSGFQSAMDLVSLMKQIDAGNHPLFGKGTTVDLFAYSISCMLLQTLMISNPGNVLKNSRIVLFAGGSLFSYIRGISRFIMDSVAFETLRQFYVGHSVTLGRPSKEIDPLLDHNFGRSFSALLTSDGLKKKREKALNEFSDNLMIIGLKADRIMPSDGIKAAFGEKLSREKFTLLDFPYPYSHENPFPVISNKFGKQVEDAFLSVFRPTLSFLS